MVGGDDGVKGRIVLVLVIVLVRGCSEGLTEHFGEHLTCHETSNSDRKLGLPQLENIEAIERRLWSAADQLRANSNYASNEYFLPVMGLVFLRHAYSRFLAVKDGIEANLPSRGGVKRAVMKEDFSQKSSIYLRPEAQ